jgi:tetratricopeptide (TPR) repeat protein
MFSQQLSIGTVKQQATCAVTGVQGNVILNCPGLDPKALETINRQFSNRLHDKDLQIDKLTTDANDWRDKYLALTTRLAEAEIGRGLKKHAEELLKQGKLDEAGTVLDKVIDSEEPEVDQAAKAHFDRAALFELQLQPLQALPHYEKAWTYRPDNPEYGLAYATLLTRQNQFDAAAPVFEKVLSAYRRLAVANPAVGLPGIAKTLNGLGFLYSYTQRFKEAAGCYTEALSTYQELAKSNPVAHLPDVAMTLNNLGTVYSRTAHLNEAEDAYTEALSTYRNLTKTNSEAYLPGVAMALTNLGALYSNTRRLREAADTDNEALSTYRDVAKTNPAYMPEVAIVLNNLGILYEDLWSPKEATDAYTEALLTYRNLARTNPAAYMPDVAMALNNLGVFYSVTGQLEKASAAYVEALSIRRDLAVMNPAAYLPDVAMTLNNLGNLYHATGRLQDATGAYTEALSIRCNDAMTNPATYLHSVRNVLTNIANLTSSLQPGERVPLCARAFKTFTLLSISDPASFAPEIVAACPESAQAMGQIKAEPKP